MKKFIISLAFILSTSAFATSLAPRETIATLTNVNEDVASIEADNYGELIISPRHSRVAIKKNVSNKTRAQIFEMASLLSNAEIKNDHRTMICKMVPPRYQPLLSVSAKQGNYFTGELHSVLSFSNCAISNIMYPKDAFMKTIAQDLKKLLMVLADEYGEE
ncbi:MAG: hypothetical protein AABZ55_09760 [Bdellovibrionota bacterium]